MQVRSEIKKKLTASKQALEKLGPKRDTDTEQAKCLLDMSMRFQDIVTSALNANYFGDDCFDHLPSLRFATAIVTRNEDLAESLEKYGHSYEFMDANSEAHEKNEKTNSPKKKGAEREVVKLRAVENHDLLEDLMYGEDTIDATISEDTLEWITEVYESSRGFEIGTFDSSLLAMTMKIQSTKWKGFAQGYISDVITMAHSFITDLLKLLCPDLRMRDGLTSILLEDLTKMYQDAIKHVNFLLDVERMGTPTTFNEYFSEDLEKR